MRRIPLLHALLLCLSAIAGCAPPPGPFISPPAGESPTLQPFASEEELVAVEAELRRQREIEERRARREPPPPPAAPPPPPAAGAESITNTQTQGVDEGGIVKVHGDHLVVLRRGRLFTIRIGGDALRPVAAVDAFAPGVSPQYSWYDEMLVSGDNVVVIGFSYQRGGTELGIFRIGADGSLAHRATYHLRSRDYYSARNYASRLIGSRLVFYAPLPVRGGLLSSLPAMRRWGGADSAWARTASIQRIYKPAGEMRVTDGPTLHTVTSCDLAAPELRCESTALLGPSGREFYVSGGSVYVWAAPWREDESAMLYRMPLDGSAPTGLRARGRPIDQFSFLESADGHLNVLTRTGAPWEWSSEQPSDRVGMWLLRVPLSALADGSRAAPPEAYRPLPIPARNRSPQNRFVGDWLLYGSGAGWGSARPGGTTAYAVRWAGGGEAQALELPHEVDRIEAMGRAAMLIGGDGQGLHFTSVSLDGSGARPVDRYTRPGASQGETRSHGFFYRPDGENGGMLALPIRGAAEPGWEHLRRGSAAVVYLRNDALRLRELGTLAADPDAGGDDGCRASCVDWYGNARPIFLRGRVFALMGYELVEGALDDGRLRERRRVSFAPRVAPRDFAGDWTFNETIGNRGDPYFCASTGSMRLDQAGASVTIRYRQTGECAIDGATTPSDGEGSGRGTVQGNGLTLDVGPCRYQASFGAAHWMSGVLRCTVSSASGDRIVTGRWDARRTPP